MAEDLPYMAEYAKSGRASCKGCKSKIDNNELRLAVMVQSPMFDGKTPNWYHFMCFFAKQRPKSVGDIDKFGTLRYEDQKRIEEKIESKLAAGTTDDDLKDFATEYAKTGKATCRGCSEKIAKGEVRISKNDYDSHMAKMRGPIPQWYHIDCFVAKRDDLNYTLGADSLPGFMTLGVDDQKKLKEKLKKQERKRKPKEESGDAVDGPSAPKQPKKEVDPAEEKALKQQSDRVFKLRDSLQKNLSKKELQELLEFNSLDIPPGESRILDLLSDCMAFGVTARCPECKEGQLKLKTHGYVCTGNISGWTKCSYVTLEPVRTPFKVPPEFKESYPFLNKFKAVTSKRIFPKNLPKPSEPSTSANGQAAKQRPLDGLEVVFGKTETPAEELKKKLAPLGAKIVAKVTEKTLCLISTPEEVKKKSKRVREAEQLNVHVVSEKFVDSLVNGGPATDVEQFKLATWGGDAGSKIEKYKSKSQMDRMFAKSGPSKMKLTVKGLAAVEPESGLADVAHVYTKNDEIYSSVLGQVDVSRGTNSYYKLQLLESDSKGRQENCKSADPGLKPPQGKDRWLLHKFLGSVPANDDCLVGGRSEQPPPPAVDEAPQSPRASSQSEVSEGSVLTDSRLGHDDEADGSSPAGSEEGSGESADSCLECLLAVWREDSERVAEAERRRLELFQESMKLMAEANGIELRKLLQLREYFASRANQLRLIKSRDERMAEAAEVVSSA